MPRMDGKRHPSEIRLRRSCAPGKISAHRFSARIPDDHVATCLRIGRGLVFEKGDEARVVWVAEHIVPLEPALRRKLAMWRLPIGLEVDDVVQECYVKLAQLPDVRSIHTPAAYLHRIARSLVLQHIRHMRVVPIDSVSEFERLHVRSDVPTPEEVVADREQLLLLAHSVLDFAPAARIVFEMRIMDDLPYRDIARHLGISENAVQKQMARCLKILMKRLGRGGSAPAQASMTATGNNASGSLRRNDGRENCIDRD